MGRDYDGSCGVNRAIDIKWMVILGAFEVGLVEAKTLVICGFNI